MNNPKRGEIWRVDLEPTVGSELQKARPCVIVSADSVGRLPLRIIVPLTGWNSAFAGYPWCVPIAPSPNNGLSKLSSADTFQIRAVSLLRISELMGSVTDEQIQVIIKAILICVDAET